MSKIRMDYDYSRDRRLNNLSSLFERKPKNPYLMELVHIVETDGWEDDPVLVAKVKALRRITWRISKDGTKPKNRFRIYTITDTEGNSFKTHSTRLLASVLNRQGNYITEQVKMKDYFEANGYMVTGEVLDGGRVHIHKDKTDEAIQAFHEGGLKLLRERYGQL